MPVIGIVWYFILLQSIKLYSILAVSRLEAGDHSCLWLPLFAGQWRTTELSGKA